MNNWTVIRGLIVILIVSGGAYLSLKDEPASLEQDSVAFTPLTSAELSSMLDQKDFKLIDVHIPEQKHIPGTDWFLPYNNIEAILAVLPDKNEKIVLYCRSGGMGKIVAEKLVKSGYDNVYNLTNGLNEWVKEGRNTLPIGSVKSI